MKKVLYSGFCLLLAAGFGCAITDYGVITDNDQGRVGESGIVNTDGPAQIRPCWAIVAMYSDGNDELFSMIDQKADGTSTITNYNFYTTGDPFLIKDNFYCSPDWNGCSIYTAPDNNDGNLFDGRLNSNCSGARSLSVLLATSRYYGECGRARVTMQDRIALLNAGTFQDGSLPGLLYRLDRTNFDIRLQPEGGPLVNVPVFGSLTALMTRAHGGHAVVDAQNQQLSNTVDAIQSIVAAHGDGPYTVSLEYMNVRVDAPIAFTSAEDINRFGRLHY